jgi:hypothetical protein
MLKFRAAFAVLVSVCVLAACDDAPPAPEANAPAVKKDVPPPKVASLEKDMVAAVSASRTTEVVAVHFALRAPPTVNVPLPVEVAIVPHRRFVSVRVHFESQEGLPVSAGENFGPKTDVASETALLHQVVLLPSKEGIFMVTASVETDSEEGNVTRIFSIPVIVAPAKN